MLNAVYILSLQDNKFSQYQQSIGQNLRSSMQLNCEHQKLPLLPIIDSCLYQTTLATERTIGIKQFRFQISECLKTTNIIDGYVEI